MIHTLAQYACTRTDLTLIRQIGNEIMKPIQKIFLSLSFST